MRLVKKEAEHSKKSYDQNVKCTKLEPGDLSWLGKMLSKESIKSAIDGKIPLSCELVHRCRHLAKCSW